jgi:hypothetical protein
VTSLDVVDASKLLSNGHPSLYGHGDGSSFGTMFVRRTLLIIPLPCDKRHPQYDEGDVHDLNLTSESLRIAVRRHPPFVSCLQRYKESLIYTSD